MNSGAHILVVDDDQRICNLLGRYLRREGFRVSTACDGKTMHGVLDNDSPGLVILDLVLPGEDGFDLAKQIRGKCNIGIIMLTGKGDVIDKIVGLELGADDYLTKPFDERELLARVRSVLRRTDGRMQAAATAGYRSAKFGQWWLDFDANELHSADGERVHLTNYEYVLIEAFVRAPNRVFSRDQILNLIKGTEWAPSDRSVDVLIGKIRKKLHDTPRHPSLIKTVRGAGYKFTAPVTFE